MLPPVDPGVLHRNPNFEVLYKDLCARKLNPNGSTRDAKKQRAGDEVRRTLNETITSHHQTTLLLTTLSTLPQKSPTLPPNLHATIDLVHALFTNNIPSEQDRKTLSADKETFLSNLDIIAEAISHQLSTTATLLCKIANPNSPPDIDNLNLTAAKLAQEATLTLPTELADEKVRLANLLNETLSLHAELLLLCISALEQTQLGSLARHNKAKAEALHARAVVLGLQARIHTHSHPPPAPFLAALKNFKREQGGSEARLRDRMGLAGRTLELYERAGERGMRDLAKRKEWVLKEKARLESEIGGLERGEL